MNKRVPEIKPIYTEDRQSPYFREDPVTVTYPADSVASGQWQYTIRYGRITDPGKFEGERPYVPFYWDQYLNGCADSDDGRVLRFKVTKDDRQLFPGMLNRRRVISLIQTDYGFVCEV